ncbi:speckle-type POZ protein B isoform X2 [Microplitis demolitor]|uniref:speckle-type POZ protein B isoform X2 n=1 Tax=Microplitis demolitor TaxID=69319 RepID=UPI0004CCF038|nr:speckle-type POZ protein B isoform X2 [Microplitis demolitor]
MEVTGYSKIQKYEITFKWEIDCLLQFIESADYDKSDRTLESPQFSTGASFKDTWFVDVRVDSSKLSKIKGWLSVNLNLFSCELPEVRAEFLVSILNNKNEKTFIQQSCSRNFKNYQDWGIAHFIKINELFENKDNYFSNNSTLILCVELAVHDNYVHITSEIPSATSEHSITDDLIKLFDSKIGSDIILVAGNKQIRAHKAFLMIRSPVFCAMFTHKLQENKESKVTIPDVGPETLEKMLEFIYTDRVTDLEQIALHLLEAADKYQLQKLKELCEKSLCQSISVDNAIKYLEVADLQSTEDFYQYVLRFVAINASKIVKTEDYKALERDDPALISMILTKICSI